MSTPPVRRSDVDLTRMTMEDAVVPGATVHQYREMPTRPLRIHVVDERATSENGGAVVLFHGGGWTLGSPLFVGLHARALLELGLVVALPEYRVGSRDHTTIADSVDDAIAAAEWILDHADEINVDPHRVALAGSSAGAHLALMAAAARPGAFRALVLWNTPCDLDDAAPAAAMSPEERRRLSPVTYASSATTFPPALLLHGADDATVPVRGAERFTAAVNVAGGDAELIAFPGGGHGFERPERDGGASFSRCLDAATALMERTGVLVPRASRR